MSSFFDKQRDNNIKAYEYQDGSRVMYKVMDNPGSDLFSIDHDIDNEIITIKLKPVLTTRLRALLNEALKEVEANFKLEVDNEY